MKILFIRHGITDWNLQRRIQGWTDIPLSDRGRAHLANQQLPEKWQSAQCYTSTLQRTIETAQLLLARNSCPVEALCEMQWGQWEGSSLSDLREKWGDQFIKNERKGLDFRPPGGESPRQVRQRLSDWLQSLAVENKRIVIVTHKGVVRAALSLASGWSMQDKFTTKIDWSCGHEFEFSRDQGLRIKKLNIALQVAVLSGI